MARSTLKTVAAATVFAFTLTSVVPPGWAWPSKSDQTLRVETGAESEAAAGLEERLREGQPEGKISRREALGGMAALGLRLLGAALPEEPPVREVPEQIVPIMTTAPGADGKKVPLFFGPRKLRMPGGMVEAGDRTSGFPTKERILKVRVRDDRFAGAGLGGEVSIFLMYTGPVGLFLPPGEYAVVGVGGAVTVPIQPRPIPVGIAAPDPERKEKTVRALIAHPAFRVRRVDTWDGKEWLALVPAGVLVQLRPPEELKRVKDLPASRDEMLPYIQPEPPPEGARDDGSSYGRFVEIGGRLPPVLGRRREPTLLEVRLHETKSRDEPGRIFYEYGFEPVREIKIPPKAPSAPPTPPGAGLEEPAGNIWMQRGNGAIAGLAEPAAPIATPAAVAPVAGGLEEVPAFHRRTFLKITAGSIVAASAAMTAVDRLVQSPPVGDGMDLLVFPNPILVMDPWGAYPPGPAAPQDVVQLEISPNMTLPVFIRPPGHLPSAPISRAQTPVRLVEAMDLSINTPDASLYAYGSVTDTEDSAGNRREEKTVPPRTTVITPGTIFDPSIAEEVGEGLQRRFTDGMANRGLDIAGSGWAAPVVGMPGAPAGMQVAVPLWDPWLLARLPKRAWEALLKGLGKIRGRVLYNPAGAIGWDGYKTYTRPIEIAKELEGHVEAAHADGAQISFLTGGKDWTLAYKRAFALQYVERLWNYYPTANWDQLWLDMEVWATPEWIAAMAQVLRAEKEFASGDISVAERDRIAREGTARLEGMAWDWLWFQMDLLEDRLHAQPGLKICTFVQTPNVPTAQDPAPDNRFFFTEVLARALRDPARQAELKRRRAALGREILLVPMAYKPMDQIAAAAKTVHDAFGGPKMMAVDLQAMPRESSQTLYDDFLKDPKKSEERLAAAVGQAAPEILVLHVDGTRAAVKLGTEGRVRGVDRALADPLLQEHNANLLAFGRWLVGDPDAPPPSEQHWMPLERTFEDFVALNANSMGRGLAAGTVGMASPYRSGEMLYQFLREEGEARVPVDAFPYGVEGIAAKPVRWLQGYFGAIGAPQVTGAEILMEDLPGSGKFKRLAGNMIGTDSRFTVPSADRKVKLRVTVRRDPKLKEWQSRNVAVAVRMGGSYLGSGGSAQKEVWTEANIIWKDGEAPEATVDIPLSSLTMGLNYFNIKLMDNDNNVVDWVGPGQDPWIVCAGWPHLADRTLAVGGLLDQQLAEMEKMPPADRSENALLEAGRLDMEIAQRISGVNEVGIITAGILPSVVRMMLEEGNDEAALDAALRTARDSAVRVLSLRIPDLEEMILAEIEVNRRWNLPPDDFIRQREDLLGQVQRIAHLAGLRGIRVAIEIQGDALRKADADKRAERWREIARSKGTRFDAVREALGFLLRASDDFGLGISGVSLYDPEPPGDDLRERVEEAISSGSDTPLLVIGPAIADPHAPEADRVSSQRSLYAGQVALTGRRDAVLERLRRMADAPAPQRPPKGHLWSSAVALGGASLMETARQLSEYRSLETAQDESDREAVREALSERARVPTAGMLLRQGVAPEQVKDAQQYARTVGQKELFRAVGDPRDPRHPLAAAVTGCWAAELERIQDSQDHPRYATDMEIFLASGIARMKRFPSIQAGYGFAEVEMAGPAHLVVAGEDSIPILFNLTHHGTKAMGLYRVKGAFYLEDPGGESPSQGHRYDEWDALVRLDAGETRTMALELKGIPKGTLRFRISAISADIESRNEWDPGSLMPLERTLGIDGGTVEIVDSPEEAGRHREETAADDMGEASDHFRRRLEILRSLEALQRGLPYDQAPGPSEGQVLARLRNRFELWADLSALQRTVGPDGSVIYSMPTQDYPDAAARARGHLGTIRDAQAGRPLSVEVVDLTAREERNASHRFLVNLSLGAAVLWGGYLIGGFLLRTAGKTLWNWIQPLTRDTPPARAASPKDSGAGLEEANAPRARAVRITDKNVVVTSPGDWRGNESSPPAGGRFGWLAKLFPTLFGGPARYDPVKDTPLGIPTDEFAMATMTMGKRSRWDPLPPDDLAALVSFSQESIGKLNAPPPRNRRMRAEIAIGGRFTRERDWLGRLREAVLRIDPEADLSQLQALPDLPTTVVLHLNLSEESLSREGWARNIKTFWRLIGEAFVRRTGDALEGDPELLDLEADGAQHFFQRLYADSAKRITPERRQGMRINQDIYAELYLPLRMELGRVIIAPPIHMDWRPFTVVKIAYGGDPLEPAVEAGRKAAEKAQEEGQPTFGAFFSALFRSLGKSALRDLKRYCFAMPFNWAMRLFLEKRDRHLMGRATWSPFQPIGKWGVWGVLAVPFLKFGAGFVIPILGGVPLMSVLIPLGILVLAARIAGIAAEFMGRPNIPGGDLAILAVAGAATAVLFALGVPATLAGMAVGGTAWWITLALLGGRMTASAGFYAVEAIQCAIAWLGPVLGPYVLWAVAKAGVDYLSGRPVSVGDGLSALPLWQWALYLSSGLLSIPGTALLRMLGTRPGTTDERPVLRILNEQGRTFTKDLRVPLIVFWQVLRYSVSMLMRRMLDGLAARPNLRHPAGLGLGLAAGIVVGVFLMLPSIPGVTVAMGASVVGMAFLAGTVVKGIWFGIQDRDPGQLKGMGLGLAAAGVMALSLGATFLGVSLAPVLLIAGAAVTAVNLYAAIRERELGQLVNPWTIGAVVGGVALICIPGAGQWLMAARWGAPHAVWALLAVIGVVHVFPALWVYAAARLGVIGVAATFPDTGFTIGRVRIPGLSSFHGLFDVLFLMRESVGVPLTFSEPETTLRGMEDQTGRWYDGDILTKTAQWAGYRLGLKPRPELETGELVKLEEYPDMVERFLASGDREAAEQVYWRLQADMEQHLEKWTEMLYAPPIATVRLPSKAEAENVREDVERDISALLAGQDGYVITYLPGVELPPVLVLPYAMSPVELKEGVFRVRLLPELSTMLLVPRNEQTNISKGQKLAIINGWLYQEGVLDLQSQMDSSTGRLTLNLPSGAEQYAFLAERELWVKRDMETAVEASRRRADEAAAAQFELLTPGDYRMGNNPREGVSPPQRFWQSFASDFLPPLLWEDGDAPLAASAVFGLRGTPNPLLNTKEPGEGGKRLGGLEERGERVEFAGKAATQILAGSREHPLERGLNLSTADRTAQEQTEEIPHAAPWTNLVKPFLVALRIPYRWAKGWGHTYLNYKQGPILITDGDPKHAPIPILLGLSEKQMGEIIVERWERDRLADLRAGRVPVPFKRYVRNLSPLGPSTDTLFRAMQDPRADLGGKWAPALAILQRAIGKDPQAVEEWVRWVVERRQEEGHPLTDPEVSHLRKRIQWVAGRAASPVFGFSREFKAGRLHLYNKDFLTPGGLVHRVVSGALMGVAVGLIALFLWKAAAVALAIGGTAAAITCLTTGWKPWERGVVTAVGIAVAAALTIVKTGGLLMMAAPAVAPILGVAVVVGTAAVVLYALSTGNLSPDSLVWVGVGVTVVAAALAWTALAGPSGLLGAMALGIAAGYLASGVNNFAAALWMTGGRSWLGMGAIAGFICWLLLSTFGMPALLAGVGISLAGAVAVVTAASWALFLTLHLMGPPYSRDARLVAALFGREARQFDGFWDHSTWRPVVGLPIMEATKILRAPLPLVVGGVLPPEAPPLTMMEALLTLSTDPEAAGITAFTLLAWKRAYALLAQMTKAEDTQSGYVGITDLEGGVRGGGRPSSTPVPPAAMVARQEFFHLATEMRQLDGAIKRAAELRAGQAVRTARRNLFAHPFLSGEGSAHRGILLTEDGRRHGIVIERIEGARGPAGRPANRFTVRLELGGNKAAVRMEITADRYGRVLPAGRPESEGALGSSPSVLACPAVFLENMWGLKVFRRLQMRHPSLAHGISHFANLLTGHTFSDLDLGRVNGTFGSGVFVNAVETAEMFEPEFHAQAPDDMRWELREAARLLAAHRARSPAEAARTEQELLGLSSDALRDRRDQSRAFLTDLQAEIVASGKVKPPELPKYLEGLLEGIAKVEKDGDPEKAKALQGKVDEAMRHHLAFDIYDRMLALRGALDRWNSPAVRETAAQLPLAVAQLQEETGGARAVDPHQAFAIAFVAGTALASASGEILAAPEPEPFAPVSVLTAPAPAPGFAPVEVVAAPAAPPAGDSGPQAGLEEAAPAPAVISRREALGGMAAALGLGLLGAAPPGAAVAQKDRTWQIFSADRDFTPTLEKFIASQRIVQERAHVPTGVTDSAKKLSFQGLYVEDGPAGLDKPLANYGKISIYGNALVLRALTSRGKTDAARELAEALITLGKAEEALGFRGGWHSSYHTFGDPWVDPRSATGNNLWALSALYFYMRRTDDKEFTDRNLAWVNAKRAEALDALQVMDPKDARYGLVQAMRFTEAVAAEEGEGRRVSANGYAVYQGEINRIAGDISTEHQMDADGALIEAYLANEAAGNQKELANLIERHRLLMNNLPRLWVGDHFVSGMDEKGRLVPGTDGKPSVDVDVNSWAGGILPYNREMAWQAIRYVMDHFVVRQQVADMNGVPPEGIRRYGNNMVTGLKFVGANSRTIVPDLQVTLQDRRRWAQMIHPEATLGFIPFLTRFAEREQDAARKSQALALAEEMAQGVVLLRQAHGGVFPNATLRAKQFSTLPNITSAATALLVAHGERDFLLSNPPPAMQEGIEVAPRAGLEEGVTAGQERVTNAQAALPSQEAAATDVVEVAPERAAWAKQKLEELAGKWGLADLQETRIAAVSPELFQSNPDWADLARRAALAGRPLRIGGIHLILLPAGITNEQMIDLLMPYMSMLSVSVQEYGSAADPVLNAFHSLAADSGFRDLGRLPIKGQGFLDLLYQILINLADVPADAISARDLADLAEALGVQV